MSLRATCPRGNSSVGPRPIRADSATWWLAPTVPRNGQPLYNGHRHLKEAGFQVDRDDCGHWHVIDPEGNEVA